MNKLLILSSAASLLLIGTKVIAEPKKTQVNQIDTTNNESTQLGSQAEDLPTREAQPSPERKKNRSKYHAEYSDFENGGPALDLKSHHSPFEDLIDQDRVNYTYGARMARVDHPTFVANYVMGNRDGETKNINSKYNIKYKLSKWNIAAMTNTPIGLRVGALVSGTDNNASLKITNTNRPSTNSSASASKKDENMSIMVAAILKEGVGLGLSFVDVDRETSVDFENITSNTEESDHFSFVLPTLYYANSSTEFVATIFRPMRHDSGNDHGYYELEVEHQLESFDPIFAIRRNFYPVTSDNSRDNYELSAGGRFFIGKRSNIVTQLIWSEISYAQARNASPTNIASASISARASFWLAPQQCLGLSAAYLQGHGSDKTGGIKSKHEVRGLAFGANYGIRI
jgi:hypothetical protein